MSGNLAKASRFPLFFGTLFVFALLLPFSSCGPHINASDAPIPEPAPFAYTGTEVIPEKWWREFNSPQLNTLIDSALGRNLDLATTWEQFQEVRAIKRREASFLFPEVSAQLQTGISRPERDFAGGENTQTGLVASYEVDLWGRLRANAQAAGYRMDASYFDYQAAALSLSAQIASTWFQYLTAVKQLQLANEQIETNEDIIKLIRVRFGGGTITGVDILRQTQLLEATKNQKLIYETNLALLRNQLSVLLARPPQNVMVLPSDSLPALPPLPETGLPLDLVRRRPDIQQAYSLLLAADRNMASAVRNQYPRISLDAAAQFRSNDYINLFENWAYTLTGNIVAPLFYGRRLRAEVSRTEAIKNQQLYQYGQVVLNAFREVEDALVRENKQAERIAVLEKRLDLAQKTNGQLRTEFLYGMTEYLDILLALDQEQQLRRDMLVAKQEQLEIRIALYRALAGAFETEREKLQKE